MSRPVADLGGVMRVGRALAEMAGTATVVVTPGVHRVGAVDDDVTVVAGGDGDGVLTGIRTATGDRVLVTDDGLPVTPSDVARHRASPQRPRDVTVLVDVAAPVRGAPVADAAASFAVDRGRHAVFDRLRALDHMGSGDLADVVSAAALVQRMSRAGWTFAVDHRAAGHPVGHRAAYDLGRATAAAYRADHTVLSRTALGEFRRASLPALVVRRAAVATPSVAGAVARVARGGSSIASFAVDALFWKGVRDEFDRRTWRAAKSGVSILMYHAFSERRRERSRYVVASASFRHQLRMLRLLRRRVMALDEYAELRLSSRLPPPRTTVLTMDDGYDDVYRVALPVLARHAYPATVFAVTARVGMANDWSTLDALRGRRLADWDALRAGVAAGLDVGGHTRTHAAIDEIEPADATNEIAGSFSDLTARLDRPPVAFAFPYGSRAPDGGRTVLDAGYRVACTTRAGINSPGEPVTELRRAEVRGDDRLWRFVLAVVFGSPRPLHDARRP
jgi:peptidoglycan/xylan/chitin deacetylase (PgdA/CDA1 family)